MKKVRNSAIVAVALITLTLALAQPVHAQTLSVRTDRASYVPGDSGTLFITIVNESPTATVEIRNITVFFPWAGFVDGKWQGNVSQNLSPFVTLSTTVSTPPANTYSYQTGFTVPGWFGGGFQRSCPNNPVLRYGLYVACILLGTNGNQLRYGDTDLTDIAIAAAVYSPLSLVSLAVPIVTLVVLVVATAFLFLTWTSLRRLELKK